MAGIVGIIDRQNKDDFSDLLERMATSIRHFSNYKDDYWVNDKFGCARAQPVPGFNPEPLPILNGSKDLAVFMYGVIYNYEDELSKLKEKGYRFQYNNDPEFFLHLYEDIGDKAVENLNGSFCIILFNLKTNEVKIFSDRFGSRPIYYYNNEKENRFLFASEIKAILKDKTVDKTPNYDAFAHSVTIAHLFREETFFKHINLVPTASIMTISKEGISTRNYHELKWVEKDFKSLDYYGTKYAESFAKAVKIRWEKGKKLGRIGTMLSGGLDSRIILAALEHEGYPPSEITSVTMGVDGTHEPALTKMVADAAGIDHKFIKWGDHGEFFKTGLKASYFADGMYGTTSGPWIWSYHRYKEHLDIVLNGLGPECGLCEGIHYVKQSDCHSKEELINRIMKQDPLIDEGFVKNLFTPEAKKHINNWVSDEVSTLINSYEPKLWTNLWDHFYIYQRLKRINLNTKVLLRNIMEEDGPIYDNDVLDVLTSIPPELRYYKFRFFRDAFMKLSKNLADIPQESTRLPPSCPPKMWEFGDWLYRQQMELFQKLLLDSPYQKEMKEHIENFQFGYGQGEKWLREEENWKAFITEILLDGHLEKRDIFNIDIVKEIVEEYFDSSIVLPNTSKKVWLVDVLLNIELWFRFFIDEDFSLAKKWGGYEEYWEI